MADPMAGPMSGGSTSRTAARAAELALARVPFVQATVVRAVHPTSAHAGDTALVQGDGEIEGFVGGTCAESAVRTHALEVLRSGEPLLLRIEAGEPSTTVEEGAVTVANPCVSGGTVEIFLEPHRPAPRMVVVGDTPVARALVSLAGPLGMAVEAGGRPSDGDPVAGDGSWSGVAAVVVASHGRGEEPALEQALRSGVPYVGLVASRTRAAAVLASLDAAGTDRVHSPAGLDIGGRTAPEIALSILAEMIEERAAATGPARAIDDSAPVVDPVCGMTVAVTGSGSGAAPQAVVDGVTYAFCGEHCRTTFLAGPGRYAAVS